MSTYSPSYYDDHRSAILKRNSVYRAKKRQELNAAGQEYYDANKEEVKRKRRERHQKAKQEAFDALGGKCKHCGFSDPRALQIDHVYGRGNDEAKLRDKGEKYYHHVAKEVRSGSPKYQLLCANCNWIKRHEQGEHN